MRFIYSNKKGFTIFELIIAVTIFMILFSTTTLVIANLYGRQNLKNHGLRMLEDIREAQRNSVSQKNDSAWGIKLDTTTTPDRYVYFKGNSYATRTTSFDRIVVFPNSVFFDSITLNGSGTEMIFDQESGRTTAYGYFKLVTSDSVDGIFTVYVNALGLVDYAY